MSPGSTLFDETHQKTSTDFYISTLPECSQWPKVPAVQTFHVTGDYFILQKYVFPPQEKKKINQYPTKLTNVLSLIHIGSSGTVNPVSITNYWDGSYTYSN